MNVTLSTPQVNFLEDSLRSEDADKGDMSARHRGVRKPQTTFKGPLLHVRYVGRLVLFTRMFTSCSSHSFPFIFFFYIKHHTKFMAASQHQLSPNSPAAGVQSVIGQSPSGRGKMTKNSMA